MADRGPELKQEENYPLLKVDTEGGDMRGNTQTSFTTGSPGWTIASGRKLSWVKRWPEFFSACWMTFVLLGISFVVFYALGVSVYRHQRLFFIKCNDTNPSSRVFYHHIITGESYLPFNSYYRYLSNMAEQYPNLFLHLYFLIDDSHQNVYHSPRHGRIINTFLQLRKINSFEKNNKKDIQSFQLKYRNVNITVMPLSIFMALTPMRYRMWRAMPTSYLSFYLRVFSVWQNGGVAMDLSVFTEQYNSRYVDNRITAILRQHNDGIQTEIYSNILNNIDRKSETGEEESEIFGLINQIFSEIRSYLNKTLLFSSTSEGNHNIKAPLQRNKRDVKDLAKEYDSNFTTDYIYLSNSSDSKENKVNVSISYIIPTRNDSVKDFNLRALNNTGLNETNKIFGMRDFNMNSSSDVKQVTSNSSETPSVMFFYDFSFLNDGMVSAYVWQDFLNLFGDSTKQTEIMKKEKDNRTVHLLSIESDGIFVAASSHLHPLLGYLLANGYHHIQPKFAIQDALLTQCSGYFRKDIYCDNIYLF